MRTATYDLDRRRDADADAAESAGRVAVLTDSEFVGLLAVSPRARVDAGLTIVDAPGIRSAATVPAGGSTAAALAAAAAEAAAAASTRRVATRQVMAAQRDDIRAEALSWLSDIARG